MNSERRWSPLRTTAVIVLTVPFLYPFVYMAFTALKPTNDYVHHPVGLPHGITLSHVSYAWHGADLGHAMVNSLIAVGIGVVVVVCVCSTAAFWFVRHRGRFAKVLLVSLGSLWMIPFVVYLIPLFVVLNDLNLGNSLVTLGLVYAAINAPFGLWLMWAFYQHGLPAELLEAAEIDGASVLQQYLRVVVPVSLPGLVTLAALSFVWMWGDLLFAVILLQDSSKFTVVAASATLVREFHAAIQESSAAALISIMPALLVFLLAQRAIMRGFIAGIGK